MKNCRESMIERLMNRLHVIVVDDDFKMLDCSFFTLNRVDLARSHDLYSTIYLSRTSPKEIKLTFISFKTLVVHTLRCMTISTESHSNHTQMTHFGRILFFLFRKCNKIMTWIKYEIKIKISHHSGRVDNKKNMYINSTLKWIDHLIGCSSLVIRNRCHYCCSKLIQYLIAAFTHAGTCISL